MRPIDIHPEGKVGDSRHAQRSRGLNATILEFESRGYGVEIKLRHELGRVPVGAFPMNYLRMVAYEPKGSTVPYVCSAWDSEFCYFMPLSQISRTLHRFLVF